MSAPWDGMVSWDRLAADVERLHNADSRLKGHVDQLAAHLRDRWDANGLSVHDPDSLYTAIVTVQMLRALLDKANPAEHAGIATGLYLALISYVPEGT